MERHLLIDAIDKSRLVVNIAQNLMKEVGSLEKNINNAKSRNSSCSMFSITYALNAQDAQTECVSPSCNDKEDRTFSFKSRLTLSPLLCCLPRC